MLLLSSALASPTATGPLPTGAAIWVEAEPECRWSQLWLGDLLAAPGRVTPLVVVSRAPLSAWEGLRSEPGWGELVVVSDPEGGLQGERFPRDATLVTTAAWEGSTRLAAGVPEERGDVVSAAFLAFAADPTVRPDLPKGQSPGLLAAYARHSTSRVQVQIAKRFLRPADVDAARLAVDLADLMLEAEVPSPAALRTATRLVEAARPFLPDDPVLADAARTLAGDPEAVNAPAEITGPALAGDVRFLAALVRDHYSGFPGVAAATGDWEAHTAAVAAEAEARPSWSAAESAALLSDRLLEHVHDMHFQFRSAVAGGYSYQSLAPDVQVWFTDLVTDEAGVVVVGPEDWLGRTVELPMVGEPAAGGPWRFPTLRAGGAPGSLVGVLSASDPETIEVGGQVFPVHRSRSFWARTDAIVPWSRPSPEVLEVRTMVTTELEGFPETAAELRALPRVVLDLRGNWGGSDHYANDWIAAFSGGTYKEFAIADALPDGRWVSFGNNPWSSASPPYAGQLDVLVDHDVCSSGETLVFLAAQVPGMRLVGENTSGCLGNGNVRTWPRLPATGIEAHFGVTAFWGGSRPAAEGVGTLPDLWLDEPDPVGFLRGLPQSSAAPEG